MVGAISKSQTSVSGPAAGLTAVVAAQIATLGSFQAFLLAVAIAGVLQIVLGLIRAGAIADFVPSSVIKGLLAAIGLILILKQLPPLVGHDANPLGTMSFEEPDHENTFSALVHLFSALHPGAIVVGAVSIVILLVWDKTKLLKQSLIPGPLIVVLAGVGLSLFLARRAANGPSTARTWCKSRWRTAWLVSSASCNGRTSRPWPIRKCTCRP